MTDLETRLATAEARLARLEARDAVVATLNRYLYLLDVGYPHELVTEVFTPDAVLEVVNFPPGTMKELVLTGHDEIRPLYVDHTRVAPAVMGGHHAANVAVDVAPDLASAHLSAYFMTSTEACGSVQGGQYQALAVPHGEAWRFQHMRIVSGWGWRVPKDVVAPITASIPAERTWRGARPAGLEPPPA